MPETILHDPHYAALSLDGAIAKLRRMLCDSASKSDIEYFELHEQRFRRSVSRLFELLVPGSTVLDIGSHYLHQVALLRFVREELRIIGADVAAFTDLDLVRGRARQLGVTNVAISDLSRGHLGLEVGSNSLDCIIFCEIMEHITFNPMTFWRTIYDLLKPGGFVYITTPNSLRLANLLKTLARAASLSGIGIPLQEVFQHVTYGHHWKEYSPAEIRAYFAALSPDFSVTVTTYPCHSHKPKGEGFKQLAKHAFVSSIRQLGNLTAVCREEMEVVVRLSKKTISPSFSPMPG
jgi:2-polyprenyl-3-methyl-5-hydroxy-6-metoxy-1,4-benzoquinol methylase